MRDEEMIHGNHNRNYIRGEIPFERYLTQVLGLAVYLLSMAFVYFVFISLVQNIGEAFPAKSGVTSLCEVDAKEDEPKTLAEPNSKVETVPKDEPIRLKDAR